ncbi:Hexapeptide repeat of succinyl-transferase/Bacterial transferase hexapeptide (six repeats), putative [Angomonas deanei]|uniref:Hexapeptide repeat of succinyl-transferase/Bacterial transferase hexapeptide (Six repeats), putative n=1 Tax=Angomonas deanei TaxID=59799 RepID=A0A7G2CNB8_9TRYP|nr:Hexapeptide repeat of succinyl-transferase/Bacterial transferase hexapeptide (six repeats), putative [Angomonas deanei]
MKSIFKRIQAGELISHLDPQFKEVAETQARTKKLLLAVNQAATDEEMKEHLAKIFGKPLDANTWFFAPFFTNCGNSTKIGKSVFVNTGCRFLDIGGITIDDNVLIAPNVSLCTEGHPLEPPRDSLFAKPIHIKHDVWIGASATILPGVTVGENSMVAAGSVVVKDVPPNTVVAGVPAKVIKHINKSDQQGA